MINSVLSFKSKSEIVAHFSLHLLEHKSDEHDCIQIHPYVLGTLCEAF